ncbi:hypothetical protein GDO81_013529 [Engystomops pustulosus]|uniref:Uncharacterized protein n=1 Tax=Engystomops pustulosus TaxID=76066 RepID=A0AAV7B155_ENGPU|nr:hypothetical protein GDO81_013529 [Engystomops pustulosus]
MAQSKIFCHPFPESVFHSELSKFIFLTIYYLFESYQTPYYRASLDNVFSVKATRSLTNTKPDIDMSDT